MSSGIKRFVLFLLIFCAAFSGFRTSADTHLPADSVPALKSLSSDDTKCDDVNVSSRFYELLFGNKNKSAPSYLIVGGDAFGIKIKEEYLTVSDVCQHSAFNTGDKIISINGRPINTLDGVNEIIRSSSGHAVNVEIMRGGTHLTLTVIPKCEDGVYKLGIKLKQYASGIGTVTFVDPVTRTFGGLGHGVYECDGGSLVDVKRGEACDVILGSVKRGEVGRPGELSGILNKNVLGSIYKNTECGVFGIFDNVSDDSPLMPVGTRSEVKPGEAEIISTVKNGKKATYKIEITEINQNSEGSKSFRIKVTDEALIAICGGIVRGMSGSPIIQDGKLIGAVTHVMVANPTEGYGIFIENMLNAAQAEPMPKAA